MARVARCEVDVWFLVAMPLDQVDHPDDVLVLELFLLAGAVDRLGVDGDMVVACVGGVVVLAVDCSNEMVRVFFVVFGLVVFQWPS